MSCYIYNRQYRIQCGNVVLNFYDMCGIGIAIQIYETDHDHYPLKLKILEPKYIRKVPTPDGWGNPLCYVTFHSQQDYSLGSGGKDGSAPNWALKPAETNGFDADLIFYNGQWTRAPNEEDIFEMKAKAEYYK